MTGQYRFLKPLVMVVMLSTAVSLWQVSGALSADAGESPSLVSSSGQRGDTAIHSLSPPVSGWQDVGTGRTISRGISDNSGVSKFPAIAFAPDGTPYTAWQDDSDGDTEIYVRWWNGSYWEEVGAGSASGGGVSDNGGNSGWPAMAIAPDGTPYLAWYDDSDGDAEIYVRRWNGSSWEEVGTGSASGGGISHNAGNSWRPAMAIAPGGTPYLAWHDDSDGDREIYVRRWNGSYWEEVGTGSASSGGISQNGGESRTPSMAIAPDGTPYVAWQDDSDGDYETYVRRWNGSYWEEVGAGSASGGGISRNSSGSRYPWVAIGPDGTPCIAWQDDSDGDWEIYVRRWNGSYWEEVGLGSASGGGISDNSGDSWWPSAAIAPDGTPYVAWYDYSGKDAESYARRWNGSQWEEVGAGSAAGGGISDNGGDSQSPRVAIAPDGTPYLAWHDDSDGDYEIYARRWNGSYWEGVGTGSASGGGLSNNSGESQYPAIVLAPDGTPYVAWQDDSGGDPEIYVRRWNGSQWEEIGAGSASGGGVSDNDGESGWPAMAIAPDGTPYLAWYDDSDGDAEIYVRRWNGSSWEEVGTGSASGGGISHNAGNSWRPAMAIAPGGTPYLAWHDDSDGDREIYVRRWNGSYWEEVGTGSASSGGISHNGGESRTPSMAIAPDGTPYVAWQDDSDGDYETYVRRWNGSYWEEVGAGSASGGGISRNSSGSRYPWVAIGPDGTPCIAWQDDSDADAEIYVRRWNGSYWEEVGLGSASGGGISDNSGDSWWPSAAIAPDGTPYVAWYDYSDADAEIYVRRWSGSSWEEAGAGSAGGGGISDNNSDSESPRVAIAPGGTPYLAWHDDSDGDYEIYVRRWNGNCWEEVGAGSAIGRGLSNNSGESQYPAIVLAPDGTPYVAWQDDSSGDPEIYVRRWNGSQWEEVGAGSASGGGVSDNDGESGWPAMAIALDGTPYLAWYDDSDGDAEIYVRRWNGSSWEEVGTGSASGGGISHNAGNSWRPAMAIAPGGTPYLAWHDDSDGDREIYVRRWNGSYWEEVGTGSASGGGISHNGGESHAPSMAIAPDGTPYVAWQDDSDGDYDIYVRRWNGSYWEEAGTGSAGGGGISRNSGGSRYPWVAIASDGTLYVAWQDNSDGDREIYVRRWNGSYWEEVGFSSASGGGISDNNGDSWWPSAAIAPDGMPYVTWYDYSDGDAEIYVRRWNGSYWEEVGTGSAGGGISDNNSDSESPRVAIAPGGTPYVAWYDDGSGDCEIYVRRWVAGDPYEPDGICGQASTLAADGTAQRHTFHQQADVDWVKFDVTTGATYIIQGTDVGPEVSLAPELHSACDQPPSPGDDLDLGQGFRFVHTFTEDETYYLKVYNDDPDLSGDQAYYNLSIRQQSGSGVAIVVAGRRDAPEPLTANITYAANMAYRTFLNNGFDRDHIYYLHPDTSTDADGDGISDVDAPSSSQNLQYAITTWAIEQGAGPGVPFYLYMADHGGNDLFYVNTRTDTVSAEDLNGWLRQLETQAECDQVNVVLEACRSGSFIVPPGSLSRSGRVVISSAKANQSAYGPRDGKGIYFSNTFLTQLGGGADLKTACDAARDALWAMREQLNHQQPWLDDNGDGVADEQDGPIARQRGLLASFGSSVPWIAAVSPPLQVTGYTAVITAVIHDDGPVDEVWAEIYPPSYQPPSDPTSVNLIDVPQARLSSRDGQVYAGLYGGFTEVGEYQVVVHARDDDHNHAVPRVTAVRAGYKVYLPLTLRTP